MFRLKNKMPRAEDCHFQSLWCYHHCWGIPRTCSVLGGYMNMWMKFAREVETWVPSHHLGTAQVASGPKSRLPRLGFDFSFFIFNHFLSTFLGFSPSPASLPPPAPHPWLISKADVPSQASLWNAHTHLSARVTKAQRWPLFHGDADWLKMASSNLAFVL